MTLDMTADEAKILIAVLLFAEGAAYCENAFISAAIADLRPLRSVLLRTYLQSQWPIPSEQESSDGLARPPQDAAQEKS